MSREVPDESYLFLIVNEGTKLHSGFHSVERIFATDNAVSGDKAHPFVIQATIKTRRLFGNPYSTITFELTTEDRDKLLKDIIRVTSGKAPPTKEEPSRPAEPPSKEDGD